MPPPCSPDDQATRRVTRFRLTSSVAILVAGRTTAWLLGGTVPVPGGGKLHTAFIAPP